MSDHFTAKDLHQLTANNEMANKDEFHDEDAFDDEESSGALSPMNDEMDDFLDAPELTPVDSSEVISAMSDDNISEDVGMLSLEPVRNKRIAELLADNERSGGAIDNGNLTPSVTTSSVNNLDEGNNGVKKAASDAGTSTDSEDDKGEVLRLLREVVESQHKDMKDLRDVIETRMGDLKTLERIIKNQMEDSKPLKDQQQVLTRGVGNIKWRPDLRDTGVMLALVVLFVFIIMSADDIQCRGGMDMSDVEAIARLVLIVFSVGTLALATLSLFQTLRASVTLSANPK